MWQGYWYLMAHLSKQPECANNKYHSQPQEMCRYNQGNFEQNHPKVILKYVQRFLWGFWYDIP